MRNGMVVFLVLMVVMFSGWFTNGSWAETAVTSVGEASIQTITDWYEAVGAVRPRTEVRVEAQITARILKVMAGAGDKVKKGQLLISLDNRQLLSKLDQAKLGLKSAGAGKKQARQSVAAAEAAFKQARADYERTKKYFQSQAATSQQLERAEAAFLQAKAGLSRTKEALSGSGAGIRHAEEVIKEAKIALGYTQLKAPEDGEVLKRLVDPGDLAGPGKPLIVLQTAGSLRLEAHVREGLIQKALVGASLQATISALGKTLPSTVEEVVPYADPKTRTFLVKVSIPPTPGLYPGMFGKLLIPIREHPVVVIPESAVQKVGQLEMVWVKEGEEWKRRYIKTGKKIGASLEVLSGLNGGEILGVEEGR